jgi:hypothetical protein
MSVVKVIRNTEGTFQFKAALFEEGYLFCVMDLHTGEEFYRKIYDLKIDDNAFENLRTIRNGNDLYVYYNNGKLMCILTKVTNKERPTQVLSKNVDGYLIVLNVGSNVIKFTVNDNKLVIFTGECSLSHYNLVVFHQSVSVKLVDELKLKIEFANCYGAIVVEVMKTVEPTKVVKTVKLLGDTLYELSTKSRRKQLIKKHYVDLQTHVVEYLTAQATDNFVTNVELAIGELYNAHYYDINGKLSSLGPLGVKFSNLLNIGTASPTLDELEELTTLLEKYLVSQNIKVSYISHCCLKLSWDRK